MGKSNLELLNFICATNLYGLVSSKLALISEVRLLVFP